MYLRTIADCLLVIIYILKAYASFTFMKRVSMQGEDQKD